MSIGWRQLLENERLLFLSCEAKYCGQKMPWETHRLILYQNVRRHIPEDESHLIHCRENSNFARKYSFNIDIYIYLTALVTCIIYELMYLLSEEVNSNIRIVQHSPAGTE